MDEQLDDVIEGDDFDNPWKRGIRDFFESFMTLFFPNAHSEIDWTRKPEFLDKELQQITRDAQLGRGIADLLIKVWLKNGEERWLIIHIEVQGQRQPHYTERMYVYNYRGYDQYRVHIASFAIFTDESNAPIPDTFSYEAFGCEVRFKFPVVRLADYRARKEEFEQSANPFAFIVLAHLEAQDTKGANEERFLSLRKLIRTIRKKGLSVQAYGDLRNVGCITGLAYLRRFW